MPLYQSHKRKLLLRKKVRFVLSALPRERHLQKSILRDEMNFDVEPTVSQDELDLALEWNIDKGYLLERYSEDHDDLLFSLSDFGWTKEVNDRPDDFDLDDGGSGSGVGNEAGGRRMGFHHDDDDEEDRNHDGEGRAAGE